MPETGSNVDKKLAEMREMLHDMSQPLTALECCLYLGSMSSDGVQKPTPEEMLQTIHVALTQTERLTRYIRAMQDILLDWEQDTAGPGAE